MYVGNGTSLGRKTGEELAGHVPQATTSIDVEAKSKKFPLNGTTSQNQSHATGTKTTASICTHRARRICIQKGAHSAETQKSQARAVASHDGLIR